MRLGKAWLFLQASLVGTGRLREARIITKESRVNGFEVKFDFKVVAKEQSSRVTGGSHLGKPPRPRQDYPKCMKTLPFRGRDIKCKQVQVVVRKFLRTSSSI